MKLSEIKSSVVNAFLDRCGPLADMIRFYKEPTEEIHAKRRDVSKSMQFGRGLPYAQAGAKARLEENYLFDTRRFASGAQVAGENIFFANAIGQPAANNGFPAGMVMSDVETNMDTASQIPKGKNFVLIQIGISFNAGILNTDAVFLMEGGALRFEKQGGQFGLKHGPGVLWPGGTGVGGWAGATNVGNSFNGNADLRAARRLNVPRILTEKDTFAYKYVLPRAVSNLDFSTVITLTGNCTMRIWLWGGQEDAIPT